MILTEKKTTLNSHLIIYGALDLLFGFAAIKQTAGAPCFTATLQSSSAIYLCSHTDRPHGKPHIMSNIQTLVHT